MHRMSILGDKVALVVVDVQRKFSLDRPDWPEIRQTGVDGMNRYMDMFRKAGRPVIIMAFEGETHNPYFGDDGEEWLQGLDVKPSDIVVTKYGMSSFKDTKLEQTLKETGSDAIVVIGMYAEFCVAATFFSGIEHDFSSYVGHDGMIAWNNPGGLEATEMLCGTVTEDLVKEKLGL